MTTYVQKKVGMFKEVKDIKPEKRRSESRLKTYPSSTDLRNWCDFVEDRRQHIIELITKDISKCIGKLIPIEVIIATLLAMANADITKLKNCLNQLWNFIHSLDLTGDNMNQLKALAARMDRICAQGDVQLLHSELQYDDNEEGVEEPIQEKSKRGTEESVQSKRTITTQGTEVPRDDNEECVAESRHERDIKDIEALVQPQITITAQGPGKMVSKIIDLPSDFQVIPSDETSKPGRITIKAHGSKSKPNRSFSNESSKTGDSPTQTGSPTNIADHPQVKVELLSEEVNPDKLAATEALCKEQEAKINELSNERDDLKKKLDSCIKELDNFKKLQTVTNPALPMSCQQEIAALEAEIEIMRSGNPSPEEEAEIIKREVEVLKRYCSKLKEVESENEKLKEELGSRVALKDSEDEMAQPNMDILKDKLNNLEALTNERDALADKVNQLEKQLEQYQGLPEDMELLKNRSDMLDTVLEERDLMSQKVKSLKDVEQELSKYKQKAERVDELERELKNMSRGDRSSGINLRKSRSLADNLERELQNVMSERDAMSRRIDSMKKELDNQKAKAMEAEMLRLERDRLQIKLNELSDVQNQYEEMINKMKIFDNIKAERDMYKQKYEEVLEMECKCEMLKAQVDEARIIGRERDQLQKQVQDLEACICEQEDEIKNLVLQVDNMSKTKNNSMGQMDSIRKELETKDKLLAASQDQMVHSQQLSNRVKELEKLLHHADHSIIQKDCHIKCLENQLRSKTGSIEVSKKLNKKDMESVEQMKKELALATSENKRLQEIANRIMCISGDDHMKKMMKQSECAVKRIVQELGKQYKEWDQIKIKTPKGKFSPEVHNCLCKTEDISSGDDCEKLRQELEELHREKLKLEVSLRQIQHPGLSMKGLNCEKEVMLMKEQNDKMEELLKSEINIYVRQSVDGKINR